MAGVPPTIHEISGALNEFNVRTRSFEGIMQILCARIDDLNDQMGFVLNTMPDTQKRLAGAEHHLKTLVYNLQGFESKDEFDT